MLKKFILPALFLSLTFLLLEGCTDDEKQKGNGITLSLKTEPKTLNPLLAAGDAYGRQVITQHIFNTLTELDPNTMKYSPTLVKALPEVKDITEGIYKGGVSYTYEILEDAVWDNKTPITGNDYVFSLKIVLNPKIENAYRSYYLDFIGDVQVDAANSKKFTVMMRRPYILAENALSSILLTPEYVYDPKGVMKNFLLADLADSKKADVLAKNDARLEEFAKDFINNHNREKGTVVGSGPYQLETWETGAKIVLTKKADYWGTKYADKNFGLTAHPDKLTYKIYAGDAAALTDLKAGNLDVYAQMSAIDYKKLETEADFISKYNLFAPKSTYAIAVSMNTRKAILSDLKVREALAHLINTEEVIKNIHLDMAQPLQNPVMPSKDYYAKEVTEYGFDIEKAKKILAEAGWKDSNNNGTVDKKIAGKQTEMDIVYLAGNKFPGAEVGQLIQNNAKKAGVNIILDIKDMKVVKGEIKKGNFDISYGASSMDEDFEDFEQRWGTKSPDNVTGFGDATTDKLIQKINTTLDKSKRDPLYHDFQRILHERIPCVFIDNPQERIAIAKRFTNAKPANIRPYYFEHLFK
jgi:peptide/nickel transport system substrate-binding protein